MGKKHKGSGNLIIPKENTNVFEEEVSEWVMMPFQQIGTAIQFLDASKLHIDRGEIIRMMGYSDYDDMEMSIPEIKTGLDIYADVACMGTEGDEKAFTIETKNNRVKTIIEDLVDRLALYEKVWNIARDVRKYGDDFEEIITEGKLITRVKNLSVYSMYRVEDKVSGDIQRFLQKDFNGKLISTLTPEQVIHLRYDRPRNVIPNHDKRHIYGTSLLYPLKKLYPLLLSMEEGMVVGRLYRSHMRYKIVVDVTGLSEEDGWKKVMKYKSQFKKKRLTNMSGNLETNQLTRKILDAGDDFFIGAREGGAQVGVDTIQGQSNLGDLGDIAHFQNKLFAVLKLPKSFMAYEKDVNAKATLATQDIEFGRTVRRLQTFLTNFVNQLINMQLTILGLDPKDEINEYKIKFANVCIEDESQKANVNKVKADTATELITAGLIDKKYAATKILSISEEEWVEMQESIKKEKEEAVKLAQQSMKSNEPIQPIKSNQPKELSFKKKVEDLNKEITDQILEDWSGTRPIKTPSPPYRGKNVEVSKKELGKKKRIAVTVPAKEKTKELNDKGKAIYKDVLVTTKSAKKSFFAGKDADGNSLLYSPKHGKSLEGLSKEDMIKTINSQINPDNLQVKGLKYITEGFQPCWVRDSKNTASDLVGMGFDRKGVVQSFYSAKHLTESSADKWARVEEFSKDYPKMTSQVMKDFKNNDAARAVYLMMKSGFRVGSDTVTKGEYEAIGVCKMLGTHAKILKDGESVRFQYTGKKGVHIDQTIKDPLVVKIVKDIDKKDFIFKSSYKEVDSYLDKIGGNKYKNHDIRTHVATTMAIDIIKRESFPTNAKELVSLQKIVNEEVSGKLGNSPAMARDSYIDPKVYDVIPNYKKFSTELVEIANKKAEQRLKKKLEKGNK